MGMVLQVLPCPYNRQDPDENKHFYLLRQFGAIKSVVLAIRELCFPARKICQSDPAYTQNFHWSPQGSIGQGSPNRASEDRTGAVVK
jgi:hypothetical protein